MLFLVYESCPGIQIFNDDLWYYRKLFYGNLASLYVRIYLFLSFNNPINWIYDWFCVVDVMVGYIPLENRNK